jgi:hypothetical protein
MRLHDGIINGNGMTTKNDVTGDKIQSKITNKKFRDNWDNIFFSMKNRKEKFTKREKDERE